MAADDLFPKLPWDFGRYRVLRRLGTGGMGAVYLAEDTKLRNRKTALKLAHTKPDAAGAARFQREAQAIAVLDHPNICTIYDVGTIAGRPYLAMKYLDGQPLNRLVGQGKRWPPESAVPLVAKLADALHFAHLQGVIHRDIKPSNIMLTAANEPILMDFGLAKLAGDPSLTKAGAVFGTPNYMSLEQARGDLKAVGPHSDVYSLGVVLYQLLTGDLPFVGDTPMDVFARIALADIPPLREKLPSADPQLESVCAKAMAKPVQDRYATARQFAEALSTCIDLVPSTVPAFTASVGEFPMSVETPVGGSPPPVGLLSTESAYPASTLSVPGSRRRRFPIIAIAAVSIVFLGLAIWGITRNSETKTNPEKTEGSSEQKKSQKVSLEPGESVEEFTWKGETRQRTVKRIAIGSEVVEFVKVPAGTFQMGSPATEKEVPADEQPQHTVTFTKPFWVAKYPITKAQFAAFAAALPYQTEAETDGMGGWGYDDATAKYEGPKPKYTWKNTGWEQSDQHPVVNVTYNDVLAYCAWAMKQANVPIRLLSEAEYEYANRGGSTTRYMTGDDGDMALSLDGYANIADRSGKAKVADLISIDFDDGYPFTSPVGKYKPNGFGLHDMTGNVRSWCRDSYDPKLYQQGSVTDPPANDKADQPNRIMRGASWEDYSWFCRTAYRLNIEPTARCSRVGFRVCFAANP